MDQTQPYGSKTLKGVRIITPSNGARIITREEWENLKPYIHLHYIERNQTFLQVKIGLESKFGVSLTPRQFKRKIEDWGFKKNFRKAEKEQLISSCTLSGSLANDRRLDKKRIDRLRRRNGVEAPWINHFIDSPLADLFAQLEIAIVMESENPKEDDNMGDAQFISQIEFQELSRWNSNKSSYMELYSTKPNNHSQLEPFDISAVSRTYNTTRSQGSWSPLFEVDVFPNSGYMDIQTRKTSIAQWKSIRLEYSEREDQLSKLRERAPIYSPGIICTLERLVSIAFHQDAVDIDIFELLLKARLEEKIPNIYKIIEAVLRLIVCYLRSRDTTSITHFHRVLHQRIQEIWPPEHPLHLQSSYIAAEILYQQEQLSEAESIIRSVIQISLTRFGPYSYFTIEAFQCLGRIIRHRGVEFLEDVDKVLRHTTEILEKQGLNKLWWKNCTYLLNILIARRLHAESNSLCHHIMKYVEADLGREDPVFSRCQKELARVLRKQGRVSESINLLREVLKSASSITEIYEFALCLQEEGNFREAIIWFKKCLKLEVMAGWSDLDVIDMCGRIGFCYVSLAQYNNAAEFCERALGKIQCHEKEFPWIRKSIEYLQYLRARAQDHTERNKGSHSGSEDLTALGEKDKSIEVEYGNEGNHFTDSEQQEKEKKEEESWDDDWDEIFGLEMEDNIFSFEKLGLDENFLKL
ncbi:kinesin light chain protein [Rutstroemia sp. NJR-2017a BVV2]|nr:kinesin light chain protein [Rutstroemia sp. NJR-2017a BVV2]